MLAKLVTAQINFKVGDIAGNTAKIIAASSGAETVVFPEMCITGYPCEDLWLKSGFIQAEQKALQEIAAKAQAPIILGASYSKDGKLYNAAYHVHGGKAELVALKKNLPNYGVFDEQRYFSSGDFHKLVDGARVLICEDTWKEADANAQQIISINASPYEWQKREKREAVAKRHVGNNSRPLLYCNLVGGQDELVFDGGSFYYDGKNFNYAPVFEEFVGVISGENAPLSKEESNFKAMSLGLKDYVQKSGFGRVLLGVSGGIDSALVAAIAVNALGAANVRALILPTKYSSKITMEDAYAVCNALQISREEHEVWDHYKAEQGLVAENMQSRTRGIMLMAASNKYGELLLTTGNKSEIATGYCTIYGDMNGAYNPIKDLYKTEVYEVAKWLGTLPARVLSKAPTAELRENQTDQDSLPPYDVLDAILRQMVEGRKTADDVINSVIPAKAGILRSPIESGMTVDVIKKVAHLLRISEFKRRQAAIGPKLSAVSFGRDWRMPIASSFN